MYMTHSQKDPFLEELQTVLFVAYLDKSLEVLRYMYPIRKILRKKSFEILD